MYARWWCRHCRGRRCRRRFRRVCSLVGVDLPHIIARRGDDDAITPTTPSTRPGRQLGSGLKSLVSRAYTASASAVAAAGAGASPLALRLHFFPVLLSKTPPLLVSLPPALTRNTHTPRSFSLSVLQGRGRAGDFHFHFHFIFWTARQTRENDSVGSRYIR